MPARLEIRAVANGVALVAMLAGEPSLAQPARPLPRAPPLNASEVFAHIRRSRARGIRKGDHGNKGTIRASD